MHWHNLQLIIWLVQWCQFGGSNSCIRNVSRMRGLTSSYKGGGEKAEWTVTGKKQGVGRLWWITMHNCWLPAVVNSPGTAVAAVAHCQTHPWTKTQWGFRLTAVCHRSKQYIHIREWHHHSLQCTKKSGPIQMAEEPFTFLPGNQTLEGSCRWSLSLQGHAPESPAPWCSCHEHTRSAHERAGVGSVFSLGQEGSSVDQHRLWWMQWRE